MSTTSSKDQAARALRLTEADNIVVAIDALPLGQPVFGVLPTQRVPRGHKMAIQAIAKDSPVVKYGQVIGFAASHIAPGDWVHESNVHVHSFDRAYAHGTEARSTSFVAEDQRRRSRCAGRTEWCREDDDCVAAAAILGCDWWQDNVRRNRHPPFCIEI